MEESCILTYKKPQKLRLLKSNIPPSQVKSTIMAYTNFVGYMDPTPQEFKTKDWVYKYSLQMFQNGLTGNCYGIASSVAAIAKELGYEPYVITIPDGHSFVMINGLYYDNMYGTLFGAATRPAYTIEHKIKF